MNEYMIGSKLPYNRNIKIKQQKKILTISNLLLVLLFVCHGTGRNMEGVRHSGFFCSHGR